MEQMHECAQVVLRAFCTEVSRLWPVHPCLYPPAVRSSQPMHDAESLVLLHRSSSTSSAKVAGMSTTQSGYVGASCRIPCHPWLAGHHQQRLQLERSLQHAVPFVARCLPSPTRCSRSWTMRPRWWRPLS